LEKGFEILKVLSEAPGVSGFESPVRKILEDYLRPLASEIRKDNLGSLVSVKEGLSTSPKIMVAAHMDEVGFMVSQITKEGFIKFQQLGGWWEQVLPAQRVEIYSAEGKVPGVIGAKAPHILSPEERKKPVEMNALYIDVGSTSQSEIIAMGIKQGDPVVPFSPFVIGNNGRTVMAKALDDRSGCALIVELFQQLKDKEHPNTIYGTMTVQEEVGLRGAATSVDVVKPDLAIILDVTVATDTPEISDQEVGTKTYLGKGPIIGFYDTSMIPHIPLRDFVVRVAEENHIPYQVEIMSKGGTDAGKIHIYHQGVPSLVLGVPVRYIHDHVGIAHMEDYRNALALVNLLVQKIDKKTLFQIQNEL